MSRSNRKMVFVALCLVALMILFSGQAAIVNSECEDPKTLTYAVIPWTDIPTVAKWVDPILNHTSEVTGKKINLYLPATYGSAVEALVNEWVDFAMLTAFSYTTAHDKSKGNVVAFSLQQGKKGIFEDAGVGYHCILMTKKGAGLNTIEDLKGKVLALVDPRSTSGCLVPKVLFSEEKLGGAPLEEYFGKVFFSGRHDLSAQAVLEGRADAAFVATIALDRYIERGVIKAEDINEIWRSICIPRNAWVYRKNLCPELKEKIQKAWFTMHEYEPAKAVLKGKYVPAKDSDYDVIRKLEKAKKKKQ